MQLVSPIQNFCQRLIGRLGEPFTKNVLAPLFPIDWQAPSVAKLHMSQQHASERLTKATSPSGTPTSMACLPPLPFLVAKRSLHHQSPLHLHHPLRMDNGLRPVGDQDTGEPHLRQGLGDALLIGQVEVAGRFV